MIDNDKINDLKNYYKENDNKVNGMKLKKWLNNEHPEIKESLENELMIYPNLTNISNIIGCIVHGIPLDSLKCRICGKPLKIKNWTVISKYCSSKCAANDPELQKRKSENIAKDPDYWKKRQERIIKTNLERYGTKTPAQNKDIAQKMKDTCAKDPNHWEKRNEKSKQTCLEKYGVENPYNIKEIQKKSILTKREKLFKSFEQYKNKWVPLFTLDEFKNVNIKETYLKYKCSLCNNEFEYCFKNEKILINSIIPKNIPYCPKCFEKRHGQSFSEQDIISFLKLLTNEEILENTKKFTNPYELDIVVPSKKFAIEFNGNYWHSIKIRSDKFYHLNKIKMCENVNIKLMHIFEYDWENKNKRHILKNKIMDYLEIYNNIDSSKLNIKRDINKETVKEFINLNSLNDDINYTSNIALFYNNNLVSLLLLNENNIVNYASCLSLKNDLELMINEIKNYSTIRMTLNYAYDNHEKVKKLGFNLVDVIEPKIINFYKIDDDKYKLYDCGNLVFEKHLK